MYKYCDRKRTWIPRVSEVHRQHVPRKNNQIYRDCHNKKVLSVQDDCQTKPAWCAAREYGWSHFFTWLWAGHTAEHHEVWKCGTVIFLLSRYTIHPNKLLVSFLVATSPSLYGITVELKRAVPLWPVLSRTRYAPCAECVEPGPSPYDFHVFGPLKKTLEGRSISAVVRAASKEVLCWADPSAAASVGCLLQCPLGLHFSPRTISECVSFDQASHV